MKLRFTTNANRRLIQIQDYHNDLGNPKKGHDITNEILERAKELETFPELGPEEEHLRELKKDIVHYQQEHCTRLFI